MAIAFAQGFGHQDRQTPLDCRVRPQALIRHVAHGGSVCGERIRCAAERIVECVTLQNGRYGMACAQQGGGKRVGSGGLSG